MDTIALAEPGSLAADKKYGYLLAGGGMPPLPGEREDFLPEATALAIQHLSQNDQGFFLMVEGSQIDRSMGWHRLQTVIFNLILERRSL